MKLNEIDDVCLSKYNSVKDIFTKSRIIITQYASIVSGSLTLLGQQVLILFNDNSSQVQILLEPKYFAILSIACGALTMLFKYLDEKKRIEETEKLRKEKELEEFNKIQRGYK